MGWIGGGSKGAGVGQGQRTFLAATSIAQQRQCQHAGAKNLGQGHGNLWSEGWNKGAAYNDQQRVECPLYYTYVDKNNVNIYEFLAVLALFLLSLASFCKQIEVWVCGDIILRHSSCKRCLLPFNAAVLLLYEFAGPFLS
jgi:hypothetical protein